MWSLGCSLPAPLNPLVGRFARGLAARSGDGDGGRSICVILMGEGGVSGVEMSLQVECVWLGRVSSGKPDGGGVGGELVWKWWCFWHGYRGLSVGLHLAGCLGAGGVCREASTFLGMTRGEAEWQRFEKRTNLYLCWLDGLPLLPGWAFRIFKCDTLGIVEVMANSGNPRWKRQATGKASRDTTHRFFAMCGRAFGATRPQGKRWATYQCHRE